MVLALPLLAPVVFAIVSCPSRCQLRSTQDISAHHLLLTAQSSLVLHSWDTPTSAPSAAEQTSTTLPSQSATVSPLQGCKAGLIC